MTHALTRRPALRSLRLASALGLSLGASLGLSGCASFSPDGGMTLVSDVTSQAIGKETAFVRSADEAADAGGKVHRLLAHALTADAAVQVALLNNKGLQAAYNELALAETDLVQQSLPPNPTFSVLRISGDGASEIERQVVAEDVTSRAIHFQRLEGEAKKQLGGVRFRGRRR